MRLGSWDVLKLEGKKADELGSQQAEKEKSLVAGRPKTVFI